MVLRSIRLGDCDKLILFGGARLLAELAKEVKRQDWPVVVFSSQRHLTENIDAAGTTLEQRLKELRVEFFSSSDINADERVKAYITPTALGIALGAAWVFEKPIAQRFRGRLFDFMGIALPQYRGGAHYTWQILGGNRSGACNLQIIEGGAATFHRGAVIRSQKYSFPKSCRIPLDYFEAAVPREIEFLEKFLRDVRRNVGFTPVRLDETRSSFFPFLYTKKQGLIDWRWTAEEIDRFICAFDDPYAGASTFLHRRKVHLKKSVLLKKEGASFHPFHAGLVFRKSDGMLFIAAKQGALAVREARNEEGENILPEIKLGSRFHTPQSTVDDAFEFQAVYDAAGILP